MMSLFQPDFLFSYKSKLWSDLITVDSSSNILREKLFLYLSEALVFVPTVNETKKKLFDSNFDRARADK